MTTDRENEFDRHLRLRWMCGDADPYMRPDASRLMRPDAERFMRPDWERFVRPEFLEHMRVEARARAKAQTVIGLGAPSLGLTLGGPLGAAAGKILADAFGAPAATPRDVSNVFVSHDTQSSFIVEEAQRAESEWIAALAAIGRASRGSWRDATRGNRQRRYFAAYLASHLRSGTLSGMCRVFVDAFARAVVRPRGRHQRLRQPLLMVYFGARFGVLGVYVSGRSKEKQACATGQLAPSALEQLVKALVKKK